uniref:Putative ATP dependent Clp protease n=1 Tax=Caudovirales sp. ctvQY7 TaxID=2825774 RepID=A0A8S5UFX3_9CAUD|nr:MAG TPA: putative ATP dependent Clp protease [Caudovirales sp. ctvQY7]
MPTVQQANQQQENKFWNFIPAAGNKPPELLLYGAISSQQSWWEDRVTPGKFNEELAALGDVSEIIVRINSGGGDVFAANAIFTRLKDCSAKITVKIDGWAASAATIIAMAGDTIKIAKNGVFMIHDPAMTVWDTFTAEDFEKMAEELKVIKQSIVNTYAMKSGRDAQDIEQLMSVETWWTGEDAVSNGFCDEIMFDDVSTAVENSSHVVVNSVSLDVSGYKTLPRSLFNSPKNPGCFTNTSAAKTQKKEEKNMATNESITTVEALTAEYPDLVAMIVSNAKEEERARIKDIKETALNGFEDIVEDAMFEHPVSAAEVALKIVNEQKKQGGTYLANRDADVADSNTGTVGAAAKQTGQETENPYDAAIDKLFGKKGGRQNV